MYEDLKKELFSWAKTIIYAVIFALVITNVIIVNAEVPTGSMLDAIRPKDRIVAFRLAYMFEKPKRFDIIVFRYPDKPETLFVKRLIGLGGETVEIKDGKVYINNSEQHLIEDFVKDEAIGDFGPYIVPEGKYFMLGDNRNNSNDSREWKEKFVDDQKILGKVVFRYFPNFKLY